MALVAVEDVLHPKNVYPVLVGFVVDNVRFTPWVLVWDAGAPVPPLALYEIV